MPWRSEGAAAAVVAAADDPRDIDRHRLRAAAAMDRPCRGRNPNPVVQARRERIDLAGRVVRRARPLGIDPRQVRTDRVPAVVRLPLIKARPAINVQAHRVKRDLANQPIALKSRMGDHNQALVVGRVQVEGRLRHNWMTSWEINPAAGRAITPVWRTT
jgi:hypothetical protein